VLAVMSHEMRTPLNGILGSLELLTETSVTSRQRKFIEIMQKSGQMLLDRVNTVLEISRFDAGQVEAASKIFDPAVLVRDITDTFASQAKARRNRLRVAVVGPEMSLCLGDPTKIEQVLVNLIGNANKFTENGSIQIEIERLPDGDEMEFRVIDTGIGIKEQDLNRVFDDFVTLDASYRRNVEGTGLGLGITRRLVQAMQGTIGVESQHGTGSVFWVRLPLPVARAVPASNGQPDRQPFRSTRLDLSVLLIEDNAINRLVAREMLESLHCKVTEATDGTDGLALADTTRFDVILMDISMPRLDGVEASRKIRQGKGLNATTPIIALTAHALAEDHARFRAAGMTDALVKPVARAELEAALSALKQPRPDLSEHQGSPAAGELNDLLGDKRSRAIRKEAREELSTTLQELARLEVGAEAPRFSAAVHEMLGLASVVGFDHLIPHLRAAGAAIRSGDGQAVLTALEAARFALWQE
jgi:CheY-like chemotaxis protein